MKHIITPKILLINPYTASPPYAFSCTTHLEPEGSKLLCLPIVEVVGDEEGGRTTQPKAKQHPDDNQNFLQWINLL